MSCGNFSNSLSNSIQCAVDYFDTIVAEKEFQEFIANRLGIQGCKLKFSKHKRFYRKYYCHGTIGQVQIGKSKVKEYQITPDIVYSEDGCQFIVEIKKFKRNEWKYLSGYCEEIGTFNDWSSDKPYAEKAPIFKCTDNEYLTHYWEGQVWNDIARMLAIKKYHKSSKIKAYFVCFFEKNENLCLEELEKRVKFILEKFKSHSRVYFISGENIASHKYCCANFNFMIKKFGGENIQAFMFEV